MSDPNLVPDGWGGPVAILTAAGALIASVFRKGTSKHYVANIVNPVAARVAVLEAQHRDVIDRLDRVESKLDRLLERR